MQKLFLYLILQIITIQILGQNSPSFHPPVKIPMYLSGNFGEIRSDHFHSGIDIKTQGTTGHHVFSIDEGHVSRIKVQSNGYGNSIYVTHPNGYTSVYGHLEKYRDDIAAYVKKVQYQRRSHTVDIYLNPDQFLLKKGDFIAYSGNSGSSSGPHLHFEIRNARNQHPTNVLKYDFDIKDQVAPRFISLHINPVGNESHVNGSTGNFSTAVVKDNGSFTIPYGTTIKASGLLGISVEVFDYLNGASNRCGVYTLELFVDEVLSYGHVMEEFGFDETRYVNAHLDYNNLIGSGIRAHRLYRLPNDKLRIYNRQVENGRLEINEARTYRLKVVASDVAGNQSEFNFKISGDPADIPPREPQKGHVKTMDFKVANRFDQEDVHVEIPANALYENLDFTFYTTPETDATVSGFFHIASQRVPVHLPYQLSIKVPESYHSWSDKLLLVTLNDENEIEASGGEFNNGLVTAGVRSFGAFALALDTIAPVISPVNGDITGDLSGMKVLKFTILDDLSGIEKHDGYIDNKWALFEYDAKNDLLTYRFDSDKLTQGTDHELELYVSDEKGNVSLYHTTFTW